MSQTWRRQGGYNILGEGADAYERAVSGGVADEWYLRSSTWLNIGGIAFEFSSAGGYSKFMRTTTVRELPAATRQAMVESATHLKKSLSKFIPKDFNFKQFGLPDIYASQIGLLKSKYVDDLKAMMKSGEFRFESKEGIIGVFKNTQGQLQIGEGHHRVIAALELLEETGNTKYIEALIKMLELPMSNNFTSRLFLCLSDRC